MLKQKYLHCSLIFRRASCWPWRSGGTISHDHFHSVCSKCDCTSVSPSHRVSEKGNAHARAHHSRAFKPNTSKFCHQPPAPTRCWLARIQQWLREEESDYWSVWCFFLGWGKCSQIDYGKFTKTEGSLVIASGWEKRRVTTNGCGVSFWGDENVLKLIIMKVAQLCNC